MFELNKESAEGRRGRITTPHGTIETPFFMPVATAGAMKGIMLSDLEHLESQILLCNTYHLHLDPGEDTIAEAGGLHRFIGWNKPILTDSGGFQVFSLQKIRSIEDKGVTFQSHRDGSEHFIGPTEAMQIQHKFGSDIIMCFDECPPSTAPREDQMKAVDRTLRWAKICKETHDELKKTKSSSSSASSHSLASSPLLFGIVQGGLELDLRKKCAEELISIGFDGYALGGLAVGESEEEMARVIEAICPLLPKEKPRYLMGVGELHQIEKAISIGIDMFDCVSPMREARHGNIWMTDSTKIRILRAEYKHDHSLLDPDSSSPLSKRHTKSYLHNLMRLNERYGETIACMQNMSVILKKLQAIRGKIEHTEEMSVLR